MSRLEVASVSAVVLFFCAGILMLCPVPQSIERRLAVLVLLFLFTIPAVVAYATAP